MAKNPPTTAAQDHVAFAVERKPGGLCVLATYRLRGETVTARAENEPDTMRAQVGRLITAATRLQ